MRLADALADELYGSENAGRPVYALAESAMQRRAIERAELFGDPTSAIANAVRATLTLNDSGVAPFRWQAEAAQRHRRHPLETPPALPLLVVLTLAAERMHADVAIAAHNYYARLHALLRIPSEHQSRVESGYRRHADELWGSLNAWLEAWEGERGVPTAYSLGGHAFIGLPMSQAVVRQHDRAGLHELFALEGLTPGLRLAPADMEPAMDRYATRVPSPLSSNLRRLWLVPAARERIVEAACIELEAWDGSGQARSGDGQVLASTRLLAFPRTFPRKSIQFNLLLPYRSATNDLAQFDSADGGASVPTVVGPAGTTRLASVEAISAASLVGEVLEGHLGGDLCRPFGRRPRRVVPLRWDDLQGAFVEVEQISLGDDSLVLSRADARVRVEGHLTAHARPGWREAANLAGVPEGWLVYEHVQIISAPASSTHIDLIPLAPRSRTSLALRGGFVLPGLLRKWSSLEPPEIVALAAGASMVCVRIYEGTRIDPANLCARVDVEDELAVVPLTGRALKDGEYLVAMFVDGAARAASTALLRLRSADSPQFGVDEVDMRLVYSPASTPTWPLGAGPANWPAFVNGARVVGSPTNVLAAIAMPEFAPRRRVPRPDIALRIRVGTPMAADSCFTTGRHRFELPPVIPGMPITRIIVGECTTCGLVKRFAGTAWAARRHDRDSTQSNRVVTIPPVAEAEGPNFEVASDALNHLGHGSYGAFERVAAQIEGSGLFADSFLRRQEVVGHLDVARDDWFQVVEWAVNSASLVPVTEGRWVLVGSRSRSLIADLRKALGESAEVVESIDAEVARVEVAGRHDDLAARSTALSAIGVTVVHEPPGRAIARWLPRLTDVAAGLKRIVQPSYRSLERWDTSSASWEPAESSASVGAFRLKDFRSTYVVRSPEDISAGTVGIGNAQLVKHVANMWAGDPLVGYHSATRSVVVPLGADLPGLYGRALAICSGRAPRELVETRMVQYPSVPRDVANVVFAQLSK